MSNVAVITTCYNEAQYIEQCVRSVTAQTVAAHQHIVVNDGSKDDSRSVLDQFQHIRYLEVTNRGAAAAFNAGMMALDPQIEWVIRSDGDDWLEPNFIEECLKHADEGDVVFTRCVRHRLDETVTEPTFPEILHPTEGHLWKKCYAHGCAMIKRQVVVEIGGLHTKMMGDYDWDFWIDCVHRGYRFAYAPETWFHYCIREGGYTIRLGEKFHEEHLQEMLRHHGHIEDDFWSEHEMFKAIREEAEKVTVLLPGRNMPQGLKDHYARLRDRAHRAEKFDALMQRVNRDLERARAGAA